MAEPTQTEIETMVRELRQQFNANAPFPVAHQRHQISQIRKMIKENLPLLEEAMWKDLHRNAFDTYYMECVIVDNDCQLALDELDNWKKPRPVPQNLLNFPGSSAVHSDPHGVVLVVGAWNYPIVLNLRPLVGAFAAGNCVLLKVPPKSTSPNCSELLITLCRKYLDSSSFRVVGGGLDALTMILNQRFDMLFYTGSPAVGKLVNEAAARHFSKCVLELGGKNPTIVTQTADLAVSAKRIIWGKCTNAGQTCIAPDYVMVHKSVADELIRFMKQAIEEFYEDSTKSESYCRMVHAGAVERMRTCLEKDNAYIVCGGEVNVSDKYVAPTLLDFQSDFAAFTASACMQAEIFGPLLPIVRFDDFSTCTDFIKQREKPLSCYCFCGDEATKERFITHTSSGGCAINDCMMHFSNPNLPFGGVGQSGLGGQYHGKHSFDVFSHQKSVLKKRFILDLKQRYPPLNNLDKKIRALIQTSIPKKYIVALKVLFAAVALVVLRTLWRGRKTQILQFLAEHT
eukprot:GEMP01030710.1.p1 GENE.GEMP01030710.1~~GEMP01030710.1.p1  ORF type:complete len:513 (-),score=92.44 GEMP01030710.1:571-2109(-)